MLSPARRLLKILHPEGIPWPGTAFYNAISRSGIFQKNYELVAEDIASYCQEGSLLDIGTGPGWLLVKLHGKSPLMRLIGVDSSNSMVAKARKNIARAGLPHIINIEVGNAGSLAFHGESFDVVVSTGSIHHWKEPEKGLSEVYRVLRHKGVALIYDIVSDTPRYVLEEVARDFGKLRAVLLRIHALEEPFYSRKDFEILARSTLFKRGYTKFVGVQCCLVLRK
jgi:ubiquinone/menaquinone biosynthesis C-methylase UbiE